jgi:hypothetical protein
MPGDFGPDFSSGSVSQLFIYNEALGHLGERRLANLSENREPRRVLDSYWPRPCENSVSAKILR